MTKLRLPNLIIAGVHKAATTSLFMYLKAHPDIFGAGKKELHYFTPLRYGKPLDNISAYEKYFTEVADEKYILDASPSYVYGGKVIIEKMKELLPTHKVIVILRNPVDRFVSYYNFLKAQLFLKADDNLEVFLKQCIQQYEGPIIDNEYSRALKEGLYIDFIPEWVSNYGNDFKIIYMEELGISPTDVMVDLANWLNIDNTFFANMQYTTENKTIFVKNKLMHSAVLNINHKFESFWRRNHKFKSRLRTIYYALNKKEQQALNSETSMKEIVAFYKKPNEQLAAYLKRNNMKLPSWL